MATKTVVCPECGSGAVPGRFACPECGALVAAVGGAPRRATSEDVEPDEAEPSTDAPAPEAPAEPDGRRRCRRRRRRGGRRSGPGPRSEPRRGRADVAAAGTVVAVAPAADPDVPPSWRSSSPCRRGRRGSRGRAGPDAPMIAPSRVSAPVWPPEGATDPVPRPPPRSPAGAYLSPSTAGSHRPPPLRPPSTAERPRRRGTPRPPRPRRRPPRPPPSLAASASLRRRDPRRASASPRTSRAA